MRGKRMEVEKENRTKSNGVNETGIAIAAYRSQSIQSIENHHFRPVLLALRIELIKPIN